MHGSLGTGRDEWAEQRPLGDEGWQLVVPTRRSYAGATPGPEAYAAEADDVVTLLGDGAHLVGHSSGGMVAMLAAAARPAAVRSLTLVEPPAFRAAPDDPAVRHLLERTLAVFAAPTDDRTFLEDFLRAVGTRVDELPDALLDAWTPLVPALRHGDRAWEVDPPFDALVGIPVLVVSGGHHAAFTAICDAVARTVGADHVVVVGEGHEVQRVGAAFNEALRTFWSRVR